MACGLPVVSFACTFGPTEIIDDGVNGFLVENGNLKKQMEHKIASLILDKKLRESIGEKALEVNKKYSIDKVMEDWNKLL